MGRSRTKQKAQPKNWATRYTGHGKAVPFGMHYTDLARDPAYLDLTPKQQALYYQCRMEERGRAARDLAAAAGRLYPNENDSRYFYMNHALYVQVLGLYTEKDRHGFQRDMAALIDHGFINCVHRGYECRESNLYQYSNRWHNWNTEQFRIPDECKTAYMFGRRYQADLEQRAKKQEKTKNDQIDCSTVLRDSKNEEAS